MTGGQPTARAAATPPNAPADAPVKPAQQPKRFRIMWSIYVGWMPWPYAAEAGILKKWGDRYNVDIELTQADYVPSIEAYVAGKADGVVMTNMEALNLAAAAGVDTTVAIIGDYSNGNDAVITRKGLGLCELGSKEISIVEGSVSQYLLARGLTLDCAGKVSERDLKLVNTSDSDIGPGFVTNKNQEVLVTWNPIVLDVLSQVPDARDVFNSARIPGEILDVLAIRTDTVQSNPELVKALTGAWYETLSMMRSNGPESAKAIAAMAQKSGSTQAQYEKQLATTSMYWQPADAVAYATSEKLPEAMKQVRSFSFDHGLFGQGTKSVDDIGIAFPSGSVQGRLDAVKLRFTSEFMQLAASGQL
jgi:NitT/TauT family transport system substrate-binding protein